MAAIGSIVLSIPGGPRGALRLLRDFVVVRTSQLFEDAWYLAQKPEGGTAGIDPALHYVLHGADQDLDPGPAFSTRAYLIANPDVTVLGLNPLVHYVRFGNRENRRGTASIIAGFPLVSPPRQPRFAEPMLRTFTVASPPRVTLVTDRLDPRSPAEGMLAAIVLAALTAERLRTSLRVVTLREPPVRRVATDALVGQGIHWRGVIDYEHAHLQDPSMRLAASDHEVYVTTSWWIAAALRRTRPAGRLIYIMGEDERMSYPVGEQTLRVTEVLSDEAIRCVVRTRNLYEHLLRSGVPGLANRADWFEPAFPVPSVAPTAVDQDHGRRRLVCFASPAVPGDLYHRAIDTLDMALRTGVIDPEIWSIALVGEGLEPVTLAHDIAAELVENPGWQGLDDIVRGLDLGLVLGAAPYPRDWMLRIAAHGRVVVTNRFMDVDPMAGYAGHIVTSASDVASLVEGLRDGITLASAARDEGRDAHADAFERDWATAFGRVLDLVADQ